MIELSSWIPEFLHGLERTFGERVLFAGLQGSYARDEATDTSDLDLVVILDSLSPEDILCYNSLLDALPHRDLFCGFLSGQGELMNWEPSDLFQFYHDTIPLKGSLDELRPLIDDTAVKRAIKMGACNIYHGCVHNLLYEKSEDILKDLYKAASFVVQAIYFQQTGRYLRHHSELISVISDPERCILETYGQLKLGGKIDFSALSIYLFKWAQDRIQRT